MSVDELKHMPYEKLTDRQREFLRYFDCRLPVGVGDCVMNKICRRFEDEFDGYVGKHNASVKFDYTIMRSGAGYSASQYNAIKKLYEDFSRRRRNCAVLAGREKVDECDSIGEISLMNDEFRKECDIICPSRDALCNIILDICYTKGSAKRFAWSMCGEDIIHNLLIKHDNMISFPVRDESGDIFYCGDRFSVISKRLEVRE